MSSGAWLQLALIILTAALIAMSSAIGLRRVVRERRERRHEVALARWRPALMRYLAEDDPNPLVIDTRRKSEVAAIEELVWSMLTKVKGTSREALTSWLQSRGAIEREQARVRGRGVVRVARAAERLGSAGVVETYSDLQRLLDSPNPELRTVAVRALGKLGNADAVPALLATLHASRPVPASIVSMALIHLGPNAMDGLIHGLGSHHAIVRTVCAELLGTHGAIAAARWLTMLLNEDGDLEVKVAAAGALGRIGAPTAVNALVGALEPSSPASLRTIAAWSLGYIGGSAAMDALESALFDPDDAIGVAAATALAQLGDEANKLLLSVARADANGEAAGRAIDALARVDIRDDQRRARRVETGPRR